ncbi:hypothetical protein ADZ37_24475 [Pannonibacter phragmitetus]|uniref:hypothetical protein n=1 Tax=Pannonibacter phragmitetus TaxID=121719 RepID=UPI00067BDC22|nr:hypothetical protein [Pannonibacter phragmitetus]KND16174.1 hypothetical protein ADZ37_24475 [Pannonibacter phragmitetus]
MDTSITEHTSQKSKLLTRRFVLAWVALSIAYVTILFTGLGTKPYIGQVMANLPFSRQSSQPLVPAWWEWPVVVPYEFVDAIYQKGHFAAWISTPLFILVYFGIPMIVSFCVVWAGRIVFERLSRQGQASKSGKV